MNKSRQYNNIQKSVFSMRLKKACEEWKISTGKTSQKMYKELFHSSSSKVERALSGDPSAGSMAELAECVNCTLEDMIKVDFKTICEFLNYRMEKKEFRIILYSLFSLLWCSILAIITGEWWAIFGIYFFAALLFDNMEKNLWGTKIVFSKEHVILKKIIKLYLYAFAILGTIYEISKCF